MEDDIPYLLLTPGPLTTSPAVRRAMLQDSCTWDADYNSLVNQIRRRLAELATSQPNFTVVLMQGSGTFSIESAIGSLVPPHGKLLVLNNGAYGARMAQMARRLRIAVTDCEFSETEPINPDKVDKVLAHDKAITHVAAVHCETTTGLLNPVAEVGEVVNRHQKIFFVDAMSSFGGIPLSMEGLHAHCLVSSANKSIQGVPGFGYVIVEKRLLEQSEGWARSLSLDLYDQWRIMETQGGKWRYTSPTHVVRAFAQALEELEDEGGIPARYQRYQTNQRRLVEGMEALGFRPLLPREYQSPIITSFLYPEDPQFSYMSFYQALKNRGFIIYPGKISKADTFRIGNIGHVFPSDIDKLLIQIQEVVQELGLKL